MNGLTLVDVMQLAILIILTLILLVLSPLILNLFLVFAAVIGVYLAVAIIASVLFGATYLFWLILKPRKVKYFTEVDGDLTFCAYCQVEISATDEKCFNCGGPV
ncbi:hypothetical protein ABC502_07930 [Alkalimonas sp. NCh-2]|uniref:hypothetical protein n=1 Tax=Alkalimonas sp. NCh-2 TaxID=3144846 RepID=UPI0031F6F3CA